MTSERVDLLERILCVALVACIWGGCILTVAWAVSGHSLLGRIIFGAVTVVGLACAVLTWAMCKVAADD